MPEFITAANQNIEKYFDDIAATYDRVGPAIYKYFGLRLVNWMSLKPGVKMLDIATGTGAVLLPAAKLLASNGHVTGIDLSGALLREADNFVRAEGLTNVELQKMDAEHLEFPDQTFDYIACAFSLNFFSKIEAALCEMYRVCKPNGWLGLTVFHQTPPPFAPIFPVMLEQISSYQGKVWMPPHGLSFTPNELENLLKQCGFKLIKTHSETENIIYASEDDIWEFMPLRFALLDTEQEALAEFKEEFFAKLRPFFHPDGLHVSFTVVFTMGQR